MNQTIGAVNFGNNKLWSSALLRFVVVVSSIILDLISLEKLMLQQLGDNYKLFRGEKE